MKDWPELYADYLKSEEWAARRAKVMQRAGHCCEGCREQPAIDVHHLSYEHVTQEFLFELVALCRDCHGRIHLQSDRPKAPTWTAPRHKQQTPPVSNTPGAIWRRARLAQLAAEHRARTMAEAPLPPVAVA